MNAALVTVFHRFRAVFPPFIHRLFTVYYRFFTVFTVFQKPSGDEDASRRDRRRMNEIRFSLRALFFGFLLLAIAMASVRAIVKAVKPPQRIDLGVIDVPRH